MAGKKIIQYPTAPLPNIHASHRDWPIVQLSENQSAFLEEVKRLSEQKLRARLTTSELLLEEIEKTIERERIRSVRKAWKADPADEKMFWLRLKKNFLQQEREGQIDADHFLQIILDRYVKEIAGSFRIGTYRIAKALVPMLFNRLLNFTLERNLGNLSGKRNYIHEKIRLTGDLDTIRTLAKDHVIVLTPTHFSNIDSLLMGWVVEAIGLPPFLYGAGLNLFSIRILSYFMNRLGAYKVDRRKINLPYITALKAYSTLAMTKDCHSLFFPGGTRSRTGSIEKNLKLGLLESCFEAQQILATNFPDAKKKILVLPVTLNYHFVLEAPVLIDEYLKHKDREARMKENDPYSTSMKMATFLLRFFTKSSDITVSFGRCLDLTGKPVLPTDSSAPMNAFSPDHPDFISPNKYGEAALHLSKTIISEYHRINVALTSHVVAFCAFEYLKKKHRHLELRDLMALSEEDLEINKEELIPFLVKTLQTIYDLSEKGKLLLSPEITKPVEEVFRHGLSNLGLYHTPKPLIITGKDRIACTNMRLLFYYRNRLEGYGL